MKIALFLIISTLGLSSCTLILPPSKEPIPAADPILLPRKTIPIPVSNTKKVKTKVTEIKTITFPM